MRIFSDATVAEMAAAKSPQNRPRFATALHSLWIWPLVFCAAIQSASESVSPLSESVGQSVCLSVFSSSSRRGPTGVQPVQLLSHIWSVAGGVSAATAVSDWLLNKVRERRVSLGLSPPPPPPSATVRNFNFVSAVLLLVSLCFPLNLKPPSVGNQRRRKRLARGRRGHRCRRHSDVCPSPRTRKRRLVIIYDALRFAPEPPRPSPFPPPPPNIC